MKQIIKDFYESENNGFRVLVAPTGLGKTYAWTEAICDLMSERGGESSERSEADEGKSPRRYFFITPFVKNLPVEQLKEKMVSRGIMTPEQFDDEVLLLKSNTDNVKEKLGMLKERIDKNHIVKKSQEFKDLWSTYKFLTSTKKTYSADFENIIRKTETEFMKKTEPTFRNFISEYLRNTYSTKKKRLDVIESDPRWSWLADLYPGIFLERKRIVFMTLDKFLSKNANIVSTSYFIWKNEIINGACILIDEIDSTKERIYNRIIEDSLGGRNLLDMFISCHDALDGQTVEELLDGLLAGDHEYKEAEFQKRNAEDIYGKYRMNLRFKLESYASEEANFIFNAGETHVVSTGGQSRTALIRKDGKKNVIYFRTPGQGNPGDMEVKEMIARILGFKSSFQKWLFTLSLRYRDNYNDKVRRGETAARDMMGTEDAISTVVNRIFKSESWRTYFFDELMEMSFPAKAKRTINPGRFDRTQPVTIDNNPLIGESDRYDYDFLTNGFSYVEFEDARRHNEDTYIQMYQCTESPEKIIVDIASRAKVLGLSATGDAMTVLKNYDMEYLKKHLGVDSILFGDSTMDYVRSKASESFNGYGDRIRIDVDKIDTGNRADKADWIAMFGGEEWRADDALTQRIPDNDYVRLRYFKITSAFRTFWENYHKIPLGFMMLNKIPRKNDQDLNIEVLYALFDHVIQTSRSKTGCSSRDHVEVIAGEEYEKKKAEFFHDFQKDDRHKLIITTYTTAGAGQNLQYSLQGDDFPKVSDIVTIGDGDSRADEDGMVEVDANFIYLEKPTYIIPEKRSFTDTKSFFKALVMLTSLRESGTLSSGMFYRLLSDAFAYKAGSKIAQADVEPDEDEMQYANSPYDVIYRSQDYRGAMDLVCEQAIGRMCRTPNKRESIFIRLDPELNVGESRNPAHDGLATPEYDAVCALADAGEDLGDVILANRAEEAEINSRRFIERTLKTRFVKDENIYHWQMVRKLVISKPTISAEEYYALSQWQQNFYMELPQKGNRYWFRTVDMESFSKCKISFSYKQGFMEVSAEMARLTDMMRNRKMKESFVRNGFATEFRPDRFIITPIVFNNIYKGALGEFIGEVVMDLIDLPLREVNHNAYELFDYEIRRPEGEPVVCVDFKNWSEGSQTGNGEALLKIASKAMTYGCRYVIIANMLGSGHYFPRQYRQSIADEDGKVKDVDILVVPSLFAGGKADMAGIKSISDFVGAACE